MQKEWLHIKTSSEWQTGMHDLLWEKKKRLARLVHLMYVKSYSFGLQYMILLHLISLKGLPCFLFSLV